MPHAVPAALAAALAAMAGLRTTADRSSPSLLRPKYPQALTHCQSAGGSAAYARLLVRSAPGWRAGPHVGDLGLQPARPGVAQLGAEGPQSARQRHYSSRGWLAPLSLPAAAPAAARGCTLCPTPPWLSMAAWPPFKALLAGLLQPPTPCLLLRLCRMPQPEFRPLLRQPTHVCMCAGSHATP